MKKIILMLAFFSILLAGCITNPRISKDLTSGQIGCSPGDIEIRDETAGIGGTHTWTAICKGKQYVCNYHTTTGSKCTEKQ